MFWITIYNFSSKSVAKTELNGQAAVDERGSDAQRPGCSVDTLSLCSGCLSGCADVFCAELLSWGQPS
jgi:hypothetical protein